VVVQLVDPADADTDLRLGHRLPGLGEPTQWRYFWQRSPAITSVMLSPACLREHFWRYIVVLTEIVLELIRSVGHLCVDEDSADAGRRGCRTPGGRKASRRGFGHDTRNAATPRQTPRPSKASVREPALSAKRFEPLQTIEPPPVNSGVFRVEVSRNGGGPYGSWRGDRLAPRGRRPSHT